jgi:ribosomal protein S18 acetylase RimI-like enzyme
METGMSHAVSALDARVVPVREEDIPDVVRLAREIWYAHYPSIVTVEQIEYMLDQRYRAEVIRAQLASDTAWWDKLLLDGAMVAFASYELSKHPDEMKLDKLYVRYDLRGRGYGSQLMRHVEERARARGCTRLYLQVNKNNRSAIDAYVRNGFAVIEAGRFDIGGGFVMDDYIMSKALSPA